MLDAPTALAACGGFDLCYKYIWYLVFGTCGALCVLLVSRRVVFAACLCGWCGFGALLTSACLRPPPPSPSSADKCAWGEQRVHRGRPRGHLRPDQDEHDGGRDGGCARVPFLSPSPHPHPHPRARTHTCVGCVGLRVASPPAAPMCVCVCVCMCVYVCVCVCVFVWVCPGSYGVRLAYRRACVMAWGRGDR